MEFIHISVMRDEAIESLNIKENGIYIDGTAGGGGHSQEIVNRLSKNGKLFAIDQDPDAIETVTERFKNNENVIICKGNFSNMKELVGAHGTKEVDGVLLDIGVSSHQLDEGQRGFSYHTDAPLDMRMSQSGPTAADLVNTLPEKEIARILLEYGEEKFASMIARGIVRRREEKKIETTLELAELIKESVPAKVRRGDKHPARKSFQALRIAVNQELDALSKGLDEAFELLSVGGRLSVITFHSLEDRMVKQRMNSWCTGCTCPPEFPVCVCGNKPKAKLIYKKGLSPSEEELENNLRARSARLRVCEKL